MAELKSPFRYDFVGSFLRPQRLKEARAQFKAGEIDRAALTAVENEEITRLIEKQKRAGYHAITDGEFRRSYWHLDFMWGFHGIDEVELDHGYFFHGEETTHGSIKVSGKISGENHPFVEHYKFVKQFEDENCIARQTMPAPAQLLAELYREDNGKNTDAVYPDHEQLIQDIAAAYRTVIQELYAAGCRNIQFDDCTWGMIGDPNLPELPQGEQYQSGGCGRRVPASEQFGTGKPPGRSDNYHACLPWELPLYLGQRGRLLHHCAFPAGTGKCRCVLSGV